jgi:hypothetical protein
MRIPTWRLLLTGGAIIILAVVGIGLATATITPAAPAGVVADAEETTGPDAVARERLGQRHGWGAGRLLRAGRHLVHAEVTVTGRDGELISLQVDHGTVQAVGGGSLTIAEAGGGTETVSTDDATIVHVGRKDGSLADVTAGDEVFVQSRIDGGTVLAKRIVIVPTSGS